MMRERLNLWAKRNSRLPMKILIYRDGVSESQYKTVLENELPQIREACKEAYGPMTQPKLNIVVVGKRHHTRFYPMDAGTADHKGNPKNGTVVDRGVTMEKGCKFFTFPSRSVQHMSRRHLVRDRRDFEMVFARQIIVTRQEKADSG